MSNERQIMFNPIPIIGFTSTGKTTTYKVIRKYFSGYRGIRIGDRNINYSYPPRIQPQTYEVRIGKATHSVVPRSISFNWQGGGATLAVVDYPGQDHIALFLALKHIIDEMQGPTKIEDLIKFIEDSIELSKILENPDELFDRSLIERFIQYPVDLRFYEKLYIYTQLYKEARGTEESIKKGLLENFNDIVNEVKETWKNQNVIGMNHINYLIYKLSLGTTICKESVSSDGKLINDCEINEETIIGNQDVDKDLKNSIERRAMFTGIFLAALLIGLIIKAKTIIITHPVLIEYWMKEFIERHLPSGSGFTDALINRFLDILREYDKERFKQRLRRWLKNAGTGGGSEHLSDEDINDIMDKGLKSIDDENMRESLTEAIIQASFDFLQSEVIVSLFAAVSIIYDRLQKASKSLQEGETKEKVEKLLNEISKSMSEKKIVIALTFFDRIFSDNKGKTLRGLKDYYEGLKIWIVDGEIQGNYSVGTSNLRYLVDKIREIINKGIIKKVEVYVIPAGFYDEEEVENVPDHSTTINLDKIGFPFIPASLLCMLFTGGSEKDEIGICYSRSDNRSCRKLSCSELLGAFRMIYCDGSSTWIL